MRSMGAYLLFFGVGSIILNMIGYEFTLLAKIKKLFGSENYLRVITGAIVVGIIFIIVDARDRNLKKNRSNIQRWRR